MPVPETHYDPSERPIIIRGINPSPAGADNRICKIPLLIGETSGGVKFRILNSGTEPTGRFVGSIILASESAEISFSTFSVKFKSISTPIPIIFNKDIAYFNQKQRVTSKGQIRNPNQTTFTSIIPKISTTLTTSKLKIKMRPLIYIMYKYIKKCSLFLCMTVVFLLTVNLLRSIFTASNYKVTHFNSRSGLLFNNLASAMISSSNFKLITPISFSGTFLDI